jgi:cytosine/adenosine deaminase-related metal-dependent hydrolase
MKDKIITIENCWICSFNEPDINPQFGDIIIVNDLISKIRVKNFQTFQKNPDKINKDSYNAYGRVVTLPQVNFHDHIYSRLAKGLPLTGDFGNFLNILHNLWWKVDKVLDGDMIAASAKMAALESIRNGVTYLFDHHSSQTFIDGSLNIIQENLKSFGLRGVLCFECTDRNGYENALKGLEENKNYHTSLSNGDFAAMLGLHASFTLSDDLLAEAFSVKRDLNLGVHIHVAEDIVDTLLSVKYTGFKPVKRLLKYKLLNDRSILVHGVHLNKKDYSMIEDNGAALAFCPDSNMNNAVGLPSINLIPPGIPFLLGTDGMHADMAKSLKAAFLLSRNQGAGSEQATNLIKKIYADQIAFVKKYFPDFSSLNEGDRADLIIWDYIPVNTLTKENFWGHYLYGVLEYPVSSVMQKGKFLMKNFQIQNMDENKIKNDVTLQGERVVKAVSGKIN